MNTNRYIAHKILPRKGKHFSKLVIRISITSVAMGICVMIWSFAITGGFQKEIRDKVIGFGSHIEIHYFDNNFSYEKKPISLNALKLNEIENLPEVRKVQACAYKAGILQTDEEIEGVVFKGIDASYDPDFFREHLVRGHFPDYAEDSLSNDIVISESIAEKLQLDTGQKIRAYFVQDPVRQRSFRITGIYNTGLASFDQAYIICPLRHIQKLNGWTKDSVNTLEILLNDFDQLEASTESVNAILPYNLVAENTKELHRDMFDWISLFDQNVLILVILITIVVCITLISTQLTLILEQIPTIGILQTLGCSPKDIRKVFLYISGRILLKGILIGNCIAILVCFIQQRTHLLHLDPKNYFMDYVPMMCQWQHVVGINVFILVVCIGILILPTYYITRHIRTVDAIETK